MKHSSTTPLESKYIQNISETFKVISHPTRLSILFLLQNEELSVGAIAAALHMEQSAISHQLKTLRIARLVKSERKGKQMIYSLDDLHVFSILEQALTHIKEEEIEELTGNDPLNKQY